MEDDGREDVHNAAEAGGVDFPMVDEESNEGTNDAMEDEQK
jgi:hypothetical protein